ncbi:MAG: hypothetical protein ACR2GH_06150 [Pseudonocardia sp.]
MGWVRAAEAVALVLALSTACGNSTPEPTAVPTFPAASAGPSVSAVSDTGGLPDDCAELLTVSDLGALLGLPLDTVAVRTTIGVAEPSVARTERVACRYTGTAGGPARGTTLLELNAARYTDANAAAGQWRTNADAEDGDRRELPIGRAAGVLVERPGDAVLLVVYGATTLTVAQPDQPLPGDRPRADALVDLALRVLPAVADLPPPTTRSQPAGVAS